MSKRRDLSGMIFGRLTVLGPAPSRMMSSGRTLAVWNCVCECGNSKLVSAKNLLRGSTRSCGCLRSESRAQDLSGKTFGKVKVQNRVELQHNNGKGLHWNCVCDCGNEFVATTAELNYGRYNSCGCMNWSLRIRKYFECNGKNPPFGKRWVFLDGNKGNYSEDNIVFLSQNAYNFARYHGFLDFENPEILSTATQVCSLLSTISEIEKKRSCTSVAEGWAHNP